MLCRRDVARLFSAVVMVCLPGISLVKAQDALQLASVDEELRVWGSSQTSADPGYTSPTSVLTPADLVSINIATTEDIVKYEPSLIIRRRFIGDSNGTLGMRGSNMFQTPRSMVFADGVPLHYLLQSRWNGAPRWTMVSASEIARVEVLYGPFSAEYSGNSMGGVVLIETAIPQQEEFHFDGSYFSQQFDDYGFDDNVDGYKGFISYGNKVGDLSYYFSYNHLQNESQPQSFRGTRSSATTSPDTVSGALFENDARGRPHVFYGDTGVVDTTTDNYKFKVGYDFDNWTSLLNVAYEERNSVTNAANPYIIDGSGQALWSGSNVVQSGQRFSFNSGRLNASERDRESLSIGLRLKGQLSSNTELEANINQFDIQKDEDRASRRNPNDPTYALDGQIRAFNDSGWDTAEIKLKSNDFGVTGLQLITGIRYEAYELNLDVFDSPNYSAGARADYTSRSGGKTAIDAAFVQINWKLDEHWDLAFGVRHERFKSSGGYYSDDNPATPELDLTLIPSETKKETSPKFSIAYHTGNDWLLRYSIAKAFRFPIVEELFSQFEAFNTVSISNPEFKPEDGTHHNLMLEKTLDDGYLRLNIFQESVEDVIESQTDVATGVRTFIPIDQVDTSGIEFIVNKVGMFVPALDVRFNVTYTDSEIVKNTANPLIVGNVFPRMPEWRSNLLATYHLSDKWDVGGSVQYASDSFGRLDNTDREDQVFGAQDEYTRIGLKANYAVSDQLQFSFGIDNLSNEIAYVAHPWPGRTFYVSMSYDM